MKTTKEECKCDCHTQIAVTYCVKCEKKHNLTTKEQILEQTDKVFLEIARCADKGLGTEVGMKLSNLRKNIFSSLDRIKKEAYEQGLEDGRKPYQPNCEV